MSAATNVQRRSFLKTATLGTLAVAIGPLAMAGAPQAAASVNGWVLIGPDGAVTILSNTSEIGQGTGTAIAQILADELDLDWRKVGIAMAPLEQRFFNAGWEEYSTYGSGGVSQQFKPLRKAGAQARAMLIAAAADSWKVSAAECDTELGFVLHKASGRRLPYASLAAQAAAKPVPSEVALMPQARWRYIGRDVPRLDLPPKVDGSAVYGIDVKVPGMLIATILQCPHFGGKLATLDSAPAMALRGVKHVIKLDDAVAVVADSFWHAKKGLDALAPSWDLSKASRHTTSEYDAALKAAVEKDGPLYVTPDTTAAKVQGDFDSAMKGAVRNVVRRYSVPFLCHAPMEPMNATARVAADHAELWIPTQTQSTTRDALAKLLKLQPEKVTVHTTLSGGGFGRRAEFDFALQAALIARAAGAPVKLIWSREEDMRHDFYRPAVALRLTAGINADGLPVALRVDTAAESLDQYSRGGLDPQQAMIVDPTPVGPAPSFYSFQSIVFHVTTMDAGVPVGYWRSVASSQNGFAYECFIDELAQQAKLDPLAYRRKIVKAGSRELKTLEAVCARAQWETPPAKGRHRGLAMLSANGSKIATVVELSVADGDKVKLHRITCGIDCGVAVNPKNIRAQIEGGIVYGLSAAFYGEITVRDGAVEQSNFHDYRLIGLADMPPVEVLVMEGGPSPGGAGEESVGPLAPAIANALFAATGKRMTTLPLSKAGFSLA